MLAVHQTLNFVLRILILQMKEQLRNGIGEFSPVIELIKENLGVFFYCIANNLLLKIEHSVSTFTCHTCLRFGWFSLELVNWRSCLLSFPLEGFLSGWFLVLEIKDCPFPYPGNFLVFLENGFKGKYIF